MVSGGTRAPGDAASFGDHGIAEAELTAISPHAVQQHGELTGNLDHGFAPADRFENGPDATAQLAALKKAESYLISRREEPSMTDSRWELAIVLSRPNLWQSRQSACPILAGSQKAPLAACSRS